MDSRQRIYHGSVRLLSILMIGLGVAIVITTLARGGGLLDVGIMLGLAFVAVGTARFWLASRMKT